MRLNLLGGIVLAFGAVAGVGAGMAKADVLADWTFETSQPTSAGPVAPEVGAGAATSVHTATATYLDGTNTTSPAGNGSAFAWGSTLWNSNGNDYWQFQVTTGTATNLSLSFDQVSSSTGPNAFQLSYSTDGINFTNFGDVYTVNPNSGATAWKTTSAVAADGYAFDLSSITALNNAGTVYFRMTVEATKQAGTATTTVSSGGYNFLDNVVVSGTTGSAVPEPATLSLAVVGAAFGLSRRVRRATR